MVSWKLIFNHPSSKANVSFLKCEPNNHIAPRCGKTRICTVVISTHLIILTLWIQMWTFHELSWLSFCLHPWCFNNNANVSLSPSERKASVYFPPFRNNSVWITNLTLIFICFVHSWNIFKLLETKLLPLPSFFLSLANLDMFFLIPVS